MDILFIDACPRGKGVSRTLMLADAFLKAYCEANPGAELFVHQPLRMELAPLDGGALARREALIDAAEWSHPIFAAARDFRAAKRIVVAAPYWDLSFPAALKVYIEHIFVRELTFRYENDQPIGLCAARRALYITTAGGMIGANDFGAAYLRAAFEMLGIGGFDAIRAEGIDMSEADTGAILGAARRELLRVADTWRS